jgi:hypothetical protein
MCRMQPDRGSREVVPWLSDGECRVADWFAQLNQKMGGDLKKIRVVGEYMIEVWKAAGMNLDMVDFLWASDEINARPAEYWTLVMDIAIKFKLSRVLRCTQIMGRAEGEDLQSSQIFYPCMQCADIFFLKVCRYGSSLRCHPRPPCHILRGSFIHLEVSEGLACTQTVGSTELKASV